MYKLESFHTRVEDVVNGSAWKTEATPNPLLLVVTEKMPIAIAPVDLYL